MNHWGFEMPFQLLLASFYFHPLVFIAIDQIAIGKGLILGCIFSVLNFILMGETIPYKLGKTKRKTFFVSLGTIYFRYMILAIPLIVAIKSVRFDLFATILGLFSVQIVLFAEHVLMFITEQYGKKMT